MVNLDRPVHRTHLGERVQWNYGGRIRHATVTLISVDDARMADGGSLYSWDGEYLGRTVRGKCDEPKCPCVTRAEFGADHTWNECQLTPSADLGPVVREVALW